MKKFVILFLVIMAAGVWLFFEAGPGTVRPVKGSGFSDSAEAFLVNVFSDVAEDGFDVRVEGKSLSGFNYRVKLTEDLQPVCSEEFLQDIMGCSVNRYQTDIVTVERGDIRIEFPSDGESVNIIDLDGSRRKESLTSGGVEISDDGIFVPVGDILNELGYESEYLFNQRAIDFRNTDGGDCLPVTYDMRKAGRVTAVRDQGTYGTCWAFASLGALETILMPYERNVYSVDHMSMNNGYSLDLSEGGEHGMSIAYLASWQGPVMDEDDPYGDGTTDTELTAVKHLEETIVMQERNDDIVKGAIFKYGGVETSIYLEMPYGRSSSRYYNEDNSSYYYSGDEPPNHALVLVGWDDNYPKGNFSVTPSRDGAYICKNSWGTGFGEDGYFYISYDDVNICRETIIYSKLSDPDDYDKIYQTDLLGWIGQMGFGQNQAYFANVYTAGEGESLSAVSFYATGPDTEFTIYIVRDFKDKKSLNERIQVGEGQTRYAGYYTAEFDNEIPLKSGEKFAVVVSVKTPGSERPIAIECDAGDRTAKVDLSDGEGYMSLYGEVWHRAENENCNICLKAFTRIRP